jgi:hypothetical protein
MLLHNFTIHGQLYTIYSVVFIVILLSVCDSKGEIFLRFVATLHTNDVLDKYRKWMMSLRPRKLKFSIKWNDKDRYGMLRY